jgi:hypothetical protein
VKTQITNWRKSSWSGDGANCVETGHAGGMVGYRDTKQRGLADADRPTLVVPAGAAAHLLAELKSGRFDRA